jgi:transposase
MFTAPLTGWRRAEVTERRTQMDWAHQIQRLVDEDFPDADKVVLVMDNLNTHRPASLYETFEPAEAKRICDRLEIHHTPKHGSWLNMAEIEFSVLNQHGLPERVPDFESMRQELSAWVKQRNAEGGKLTGDSQPRTQG